MQNMGISRFKNHTVEILGRLAKTKENIIITKRGKPLARIIPLQNTDMTPRPGKLAKTLIFEKDIISPLGKDMWDVCK
jgi:prevent-host-death family protein